MPVFMGLIRNEHGVYHARVKVPKRLQHAVAEVLGTGEPKRTWLKRSLETKDKREAKVRAAPVLMTFNRTLAEAEALLTEQPMRTTLSAAEITRMGAYHYATVVSVHETFVRNAPDIERETREFEEADANEIGGELPTWVEPVQQYGLSGGQLADRAHALARLLPEAEQALARGNIAHVEWHIDRVLTVFRARLDPTSDAYRRLGAEILRQHVLALRTIQASSRGEPVHVPQLPDTATAAATDGETLRAAFAGWQKDRRPSPRTLVEYRRAIDLFTELHGELPVVSIKRSHARAFREALQDIPSRRDKKLMEASLPELTQWGREHPEAPKLNPGTVNKLLGGVQAIALWAHEHGIIPDDTPWSDPFTRMRLEEDEPERAPFTPAELRTLLASPVFTEGERPLGGKGEAAFWLPLLGLFTGARRGELAGLTVADVIADETTQDHTVLAFTANRERGKTLKTSSSARIVPLHPELQRLGFTDYVAAVKRTHGKDAWLFSDVSPDSKDGAKAWTKWFGRYLRSIGVTDRRKVFHSLRHNFKDALRAANVLDELNDALLGHSNSASVARGYGAKRMEQRFGMERLVSAVSSVAYPGVSLSRIHTTRGGRPIS